MQPRLRDRKQILSEDKDQSRKNRGKKKDKAMSSSTLEKHGAGDTVVNTPCVVGVPAKAAPDLNVVERAEDADQVVVKLPLEVHKARQAPCVGSRAQRLFGRRHEFIQEAQVQVLQYCNLLKEGPLEHFFTARHSDSK